VKTLQEIYTIRVGRMHYRSLNRHIHERITEGINRFILREVTGQRYIGAGLPQGIEIELYGVPGHDLGVFNAGARIVVRGNAQDGVGNTMNDGLIVVHGSVGDIPGNMMREGRIYIRGQAGFRAGIMMKEYQEKHPVIIVGETIGDYVGEYMAGGTIIVLGYSLEKCNSPVARHVASGMFGGKILIRGSVASEQVGEGALLSQAKDDDLEQVYPFLSEYAEVFELDLERIVSSRFFVITRACQRPYGNLYVPSRKGATGLVPLHRDVKPPCANACPIGIPNALIIRKLKSGDVQEAFDLIDDYTPFRYSCCGMVCPGLCRSECSRNMLDEAVRIDEIARRYRPSGRVKVLAEPKNEEIGVIGAGPAGLSAAWHLARNGYRVSVYERESDIGGKLAHNIPEQRLPREEVSKDLERVRSLGITFFTGTEVDREFFEELRRRHSALIIATGTWRQKLLGFRGEEDAFSSSQFLKEVKLDGSGWNIKGKSVVIVGAGNAGMDVARECFRLGAGSVTAVDVKRPTAFEKELMHSMKLGLKVLYPKYIESFEKGKVSFRDGTDLGAELLIKAAGEVPDLDFAGEGFSAGEEPFSTTIPGVYLIGDALTPGLATHSIAMGRKIALRLKNILEGLPLPQEETSVVNKKKINMAYFQKRGPFTEPLDECLSCGSCIQCDICVRSCPREAVRREGENFNVNLELCTGCGVCASVCPRGAISMVERSCY
jgi:putative selenate reductase